jgi:hypothetical protein
MIDAIQTLTIFFVAFIVASFNALIVVYIMTRWDK